MDAGHRKQLIQALETASEQSGSDLYQFCSGATRLMDMFRPRLEAFQSRLTMDAYLAALPPEEESEVEHIAALLLALPGLIQQAMQGQIRTLAESLPANPPGPPRKLTPELSRAIVDYVYALDKKKVQRRIAQRRAAQHFGVGLRTAQRAWSERDTLTETPAPNMKDVWKFFQGS